MKVTTVPIVSGALGTVTKGLLKGLEDLEVGGRVDTIQTTALLRTARILRRVLETCCHSNSSEKPSANTDVKNSWGVVIIIIIIIIIRRRRRRRRRRMTTTVTKETKKNIAVNNGLRNKGIELWSSVRTQNGQTKIQKKNRKIKTKHFRLILFFQLFLTSPLS